MNSFDFVLGAIAVACVAIAFALLILKLIEHDNS